MNPWLLWFDRGGGLSHPPESISPYALGVYLELLIMFDRWIDGYRFSITKTGEEKVMKKKEEKRGKRRAFIFLENRSKRKNQDLN